MTKEDLAKVEEISQALFMQEELLQFNHFNQADAWELGVLMVETAKRHGMKLVFRIELNNGMRVFEYAMNGMTLNDVSLLEKKVNTVKRFEESSLRLYTELQTSNQTLESLGVDEKEYACMGGAFPIIIEEVGVIGVIAVEGMNHVACHDFLIKCIGKFQHVAELPRIRESAFH